MTEQVHAQSISCPSITLHPINHDCRALIHPTAALLLLHLAVSISGDLSYIPQPKMLRKEQEEERHGDDHAEIKRVKALQAFPHPRTRTRNSSILTVPDCTTEALWNTPDASFLENEFWHAPITSLASSVGPPTFIKMAAANFIPLWNLVSGSARVCVMHLHHCLCVYSFFSGICTDRYHLDRLMARKNYFQR